MTPPNPYSPEGMKICKRSHRYDPALLQCPRCQKEKHQKYVNDHKEQLRLYFKNYDKARAEKVRCLRSAEEYKVHRRAVTNARYKRDPQTILKKQRVHRKKNPERIVWKGMIRRCTDPSCSGYKNYGARGITVCERWLIFENFMTDMGRRPSARYSIERRDNGKGYSPDNCYWATRAEQNRNTRRTRYFELDGKRQCMQDWASELGITSQLLWSRINFLKWPLERALTTGPCNRYD